MVITIHCHRTVCRWHEVLSKSSWNVKKWWLSPIHHHHLQSSLLKSVYSDPSAVAMIGMHPGNPYLWVCSASPVTLPGCLPLCIVPIPSTWFLYWGTGKKSQGLNLASNYGGEQLACFWRPEMDASCGTIVVLFLGHTHEPNFCHQLRPWRGSLRHF